MGLKILVPLDGSPVAEAILPHVRILATAKDSEVILVRVADRPIYNALFPQPTVLYNMASEAEMEAKEYLEGIAAQLRIAGITVNVEVCTGQVAETVLDYADVIQADLIAMSTHGRSGMERWLMGSVADKIVCATTRPILLIRPTPTNAPPVGS